MSRDAEHYVIYVLYVWRFCGGVGPSTDTIWFWNGRLFEASFLYKVVLGKFLASFWLVLKFFKKG